MHAHTSLLLLLSARLLPPAAAPVSSGMFLTLYEYTCWDRPSPSGSLLPSGWLNNEYLRGALLEVGAVGLYEYTRWDRPSPSGSLLPPGWLNNEYLRGALLEVGAVGLYEYTRWDRLSSSGSLLPPGWLNNEYLRGALLEVGAVDPKVRNNTLHVLYENPHYHWWHQCHKELQNLRPCTYMCTLK